MKINIENTNVNLHFDIKNGSIYLDLQPEQEYESA